MEPLASRLHDQSSTADEAFAGAQMELAQYFIERREFHINSLDAIVLVS